VTDIEAMILRRARGSLGYLPEQARANLVRLTAAYADDHVSWQVVVFDKANEAEIEEYACIFTEVLADFQAATGDETIVKVESAEAAEQIEPLAIVIYP
jgi:hypothetical protein